MISIIEPTIKSRGPKTKKRRKNISVSITTTDKKDSYSCQFRFSDRMGDLKVKLKKRRNKMKLPKKIIQDADDLAPTTLEDGALGKENPVSMTAENLARENYPRIVNSNEEIKNLPAENATPRKNKGESNIKVEPGVAMASMNVLNMNSQNKDNDKELQKAGKDSGHICSRCQTIFDNNLEFQVHRHTCWLSLQLDLHGCPVCLDYFEDEQELYRHLEEHEEDEEDENNCDDEDENDDNFDEDQINFDELETRINDDEGKENDNSFDNGQCPKSDENCPGVTKHEPADLQLKNIPEEGKIFKTDYQGQILAASEIKLELKNCIQLACTPEISFFIKNNFLMTPVDFQNDGSDPPLPSVKRSRTKRRAVICSFPVENLDKAAVESSPVVDFPSVNNNKSTAKYQCRACSTIFTSNAGLHRHLNRFHPEAADFKCETCDIVFSTQRGFTKHLSTAQHNDNKNQASQSALKCPNCDFVASDSTKLRKHVEWKERHNNDTEKLFKCSECPKTFCSTRSLAVHKKSGHEIFSLMQYSCEVCSKVFLRKDNLLIHAKTHQVETNIQCSDCKIYLKNDRDLFEHAKICLSSSTSKDQKAPNAVISKSTEVPKEKSTIPSILITSSTPAKKRNLRNKSSPTKTTLESLNDAGKNTCRCPKCSIYFTTVHALNTHVNSAHAEDAPYKCEPCGKIYASRSGRKKHVCKVHK